MKRCLGLLTVAACLSALIGATGADAAGCTNEALRIGPSALLPACRAYEMVSPIEKAGGGVAESPTVTTDDRGDAVSFYSTSVFAGNQGNLIFAGYLSRRADGAWSTTGVEGPQYNEYGLTEFASPAFSAEETKTFTASRVALAPGAIEGGSNLYVRDNTTGAYQLIVAQQGSALWEFATGFAKNPYMDGSPDWSNMLLSSPLALTPDAVEFPNSASETNLYEFTGGRLRLADILPDGKPSAGGAVPIGNGHSVSTDGSRVFFDVAPYSGAEGPLYVRIDGRRTVAISASRRPADEGAAANVSPQFATADGSLVFFQTNEELLPGDPTMEQPTIYRYDVDTGELTDVIPDKPAEGARVNAGGGVIAAGEDGSLLFRSFAALAPGAEPATGGQENLYVARGGKIEFVGVTEDSTRAAAASEDGRYFAIGTTTPMRPAEDPPSPACAGETCADVYVFDADTGTLRCASCEGGGRADAGPSLLGNNSRAPSGTKYVTSMLDDGTVFFQTPNALASRDVNGVDDVYAWSAGTAELVSSGSSPDPSTFADATPDGSSVFFLTSQPLVPQDRDGSVDVYADRELGGLASQFPVGTIAPCDDESCRGASPAGPSTNPSGSAAGGGESPCLAPAAAARRAGAKAHGLSRKAKRAAKQGAGRQAKLLRARARSESKEAKGFRKRAGACRRAGR